MKSIIAILICLIVSSTSVAEEPIRLATGEWAPYSTENARHQGYYAHIVKEAFQGMDINTVFDFYPWNRANVHIAQGIDVVGGFPYSVSDQRKKEHYLSNPIAESCIVIFHLKKYAFDWQTEQDFKGHIFGGTRGYNALKRLEQVQKDGVPFEIEVVTTDLQNFRRLLGNRINAFPINLEVGLGLLRQEFSYEQAESVTYHPKPFFCSTYHVMFSRKLENSKHWNQVFNQGLQKLHDSGRYAELKEAFIRGVYTPTDAQ